MFPDSNPAGYKIWVGDLPYDVTEEAIRRRLWDTLFHDAEIALWEDARAIAVKQRRADSRASYVVVTVAELDSAMVTQLA